MIAAKSRFLMKFCLMWMEGTDTPASEAKTFINCYCVWRLNKVQEEHRAEVAHYKLVSPMMVDLKTKQTSTKTSSTFSKGIEEE